MSYFLQNIHKPGCGLPAAPVLDLDDGHHVLGSALVQGLQRWWVERGDVQQLVQVSPNGVDGEVAVATIGSVVDFATGTSGSALMVVASESDVRVALQAEGLASPEFQSLPGAAEGVDTVRATEVSSGRWLVAAQATGGLMVWSVCTGL